MLDGEAILNYLFHYLKEEIDTEQVYILGRSLGGAVAIYVMSEFNYKVCRLTLLIRSEP